MDLKKFVSCASAFTIAASAFAAMAVTASAENIYTQDYEGDGVTADWTTGTSGRFTPDIFEETVGDTTNHYLSVNQDQRYNNGTTISSTSLSGKVAAGVDFAMTFDMKLSSSTNQTPVSFTIKDAANSAAILSLTATGTNAKTWNINDNSSNQVELTGSGSASVITEIPWYSYKLVRSGSNTYLTIKDAEGTAVIEDKLITTLSENGGLGNMQFVTRRYNANFAIDNIVVRDIEEGDIPDVVTHTITTKYVDEEGNEVKASTTAIVDEGEQYVPTYDISFDDDDYRYTYVSNTTIDEVTEDAEVEVVYSKAALAEYTVNFKTSLDTVLDTVTVKDGKDVSYTYPRYIADGTVLYQIEKSRYDQGYVASAKNVKEDTDVTEIYSAVDLGEGATLAFYSEAEDIATLTQSSTNNNIPGRCSSGNAAYAAEDAVITNLPAGKYKIAIATFGNAGTTFTATLGEGNTFEASTLGYFSEQTSDEITITEATDLVIAATGNGGSSPKVIDYIYVVKTGDVTPEPPTPVAATGTDYVGTDGSKASLWNATVTTDSATKVTAVATLADGETTAGGEAELDGTFTGDVAVYVVVNKAVAELQGVAVTFE